MAMNTPRALTVSEHVIAEAITDEVMVQMHHHATTDGLFDIIKHLLHPKNEHMEQLKKRAHGAVKSVKEQLKRPLI
jgi:hypothetical protein